MIFKLQHKLLLLSFVLLSFASIVFCSSNEDIANFDFGILSGVTIKSPQERDDYLEKIDMTVFALYYREDSKMSKSIGYLTYLILHKLEHLAEVIAINCNDGDFPQCESKKPDDFVFFEVYEPPLYRLNPYTKAKVTHTVKPFTGDKASENVLFNFITANINSRAMKLTPENVETFLSNPNMNKVILFTNKPKTSLLFRGLSNYLYERLLFGEVNKSQTELIARFKIAKYPTLMIYQTQEDHVSIDDPIIDIYNGKENAKDISAYLIKYALKEKFYLKTGSSASNINGEADIFFKKINKESIEGFLSNNSKKDIIVYLDDTIENGKINYKEIKGDIKQLYTQTQGFFLFSFIDCSGDNQAFCESKFKIDEFPSLILFKSNEDKSNAKERLEKGTTYLPMDYSDIQTELEKEYPPNVREANQNIFSSLISESQYNNKIPLFYLFDNQIDLGFNLITRDVKFQKIFDWYVYENPPQSFMANLKATKLPLLTIAIPDKNNNQQTQMIMYNGAITYSGIKSFIDQSFKIQSGDDKQQASSGSRTKDGTSLQEKPEFIQSTKDLVTLCSKKKLCMIAFMDMRENEESKKLFEIKMKEYQDSVVENNKRPVMFGYVNATCQSEFSSRFGVDVASLPTLILYSHAKEVYANLIGQFNVEDIKKFIMRVIEGGVNFQRTQKENAKLSEINCKQIQEILEKDDDDEFVKEILEEERKKREVFEAERKKITDEENKGKKKKKKNKKKKHKKKKKKSKKSEDL